MSTNIEVKFFFNENYDPNEIFSQLLRTISDWDSIVDPWQYFCVEEYEPFNYIQNIPKKIPSYKKIDTIINQYDGLHHRYSASIPFNCWRFNNYSAEEGYLILDLRSWGPTFHTLKVGDLRLEGSASLTISTPGPFCALLSTDSVSKIVNHYVEENLDKITQLFFLIVESLSPNSIKVFVDSGLFLPFNTHFAYYKDDLSIITDIKLIKDIWDGNLPQYESIASLKEYNSNVHDYCFHTWREEEQRKKIWYKISSALQNSKKDTKKNILNKVIKSEIFDFYKMKNGICILDYPYFFNNFLDNFYIWVMEEFNIA